MARIRTDNVFGTITDTPLTNVATTMNSAGLANLAAVSGTDRAVITLDPNRVNGAPEIVYVSAHTGAATSATILRGQEGTAARQHPSGTFWVHAPTVRDHLVGQQGYAEAAGDQTGIVGTEVDLTGITTTFTTVAGRRIKLSVSCYVGSTVGSDLVKLRIKEGGTTLIERQYTLYSTANNPVDCSLWVAISPTAAAHTYKASIQRVAGTGSLTSFSLAGARAFILAEDIGAA